MKVKYADIKKVPFRVILNHYGIELKDDVVSGDQKLIGTCPIHVHNNRSNPRSNQFQVTIASEKHPFTNNTFHCFGCGARGSIVDFVVLKEGYIDYQDIDWMRVGQNRKTHSAENWCPVETLKKASKIIAETFLNYEPKSGEIAPGGT